MKRWELEEKREKMLAELVKKYGHSSEPTIYFATWACKDIYMMNNYF